MKTPLINIQCNQTPELKQLVSDLCKDIQDFIEAPKSTLGSLSAELDQLIWTVTPKQDIIIISKCLLNSTGVIQALAKACTSADDLPKILNYATDLPFGQIHYYHFPFNNTLTFIATYPMP